MAHRFSLVLKRMDDDNDIDDDKDDYGDGSDDNGLLK